MNRFFIKLRHWMELACKKIGYFRILYGYNHILIYALWCTITLQLMAANIPLFSLGFSEHPLPPCGLIIGDNTIDECAQNFLTINFTDNSDYVDALNNDLTITTINPLLQSYLQGEIYFVGDAFADHYDPNTPFLELGFSISSPGCDTEFLTFFIYPDVEFVINPLTETDLCEADDNSGVTILLNEYLTDDSPSFGNWICTNGSQYIINNNSFDLAHADPGIYTFQVSTNFLANCAFPENLVLEVFPAPSIEFVPLNTSFCSNINLCQSFIDSNMSVSDCTTANGFYWSYYTTNPLDLTTIPNGNINFNNIQTSYNIVLEYIDPLTGCHKQLEQLITGVVPPTPIIEPGLEHCMNEPFDLDDLVTAGNFTVDWYPNLIGQNTPDYNNPIVGGITSDAGQFWAVINFNGMDCEEEMAVNISITEDLIPSWDPNMLTLCSGGSDVDLHTALLAGSSTIGTWTIDINGTEIELIDGIWDYQNYTNGETYFITYTVGLDCPQSEQHSVVVQDNFTVSLADASICASLNQLIDLDTLFYGTPLTNAAWAINPSVPINGFNQINTANLVSGTYTITCNILSGPCEYNLNTNLFVADGYIADWFIPNNFCEGDLIDLNDISNFSFLVPDLGGQWILSGTGAIIENGMLNTDGMQGLIALEYQVGSGSCSDTATGNININPAADVVIAVDTLCGIGLYNLNNNPYVNIPGQWNGNGVINNMFSAEPGVYDLNYTLPESNGICGYTEDVTIVVMDVPMPIMDMNACPNETIDLNSEYSFGNWEAAWQNITTGEAIPNGIISMPSSSTVITVQPLIISSDCTIIIDPIDINVASQSNSEWTPISICSTNLNSGFPLNSLLNPGSNTNGIWSENDPTMDYVNYNPVTQIYTFDPPSNAEAEYTLSYSCCGTCTSIYTDAIQVIDASSLDASWQEIAICTSSSPINLDSLVALAGGSPNGSWDDNIDWNGLPPYIVNGYFISDGLDPGQYAIEYSVGIGQNCQVTQSGFITIVQGAEYEWTAPGAFCLQDSPIDLDDFFDIGGSTIHSWSAESGEDYIVLNRWFNPELSGVGIHNVYLSMGSGDCAVTDVFQIEIVDLNPDIILPSICLDQGLVDLTPFINNDTLNDGIWTGEWVENGNFINTIPANGPGPSVGTSTINYNISYENCNQVLTYDIIFSTSGNADFFDFALCQGESVLLDTLLDGADLDGEWSSDNALVSIQDNVWNTSNLAPDVYNLTYTVGSGECETTLTREISVSSAADPGWQSTFVCADDENFDLDALITGDPNGVWYCNIPGVIYDHWFNATLVAPGDIEFTYTVGSGTSCERDSVGIIEVSYEASPTLNDTIICNGSGMFPLHTLVTGSPGGVFLGGPWIVDDSLFNPPLGGTVGGAGYDINYQAGYGTCTQIGVSKVFVINTIPTTFKDTLLCSGSMASLVLDSLLEFDLSNYDDLTGHFENDSLLFEFILHNIQGQWSGDQVVGNVFNPQGNPLASGTYEINYSYGPCATNANFELVVAPTVDAGFDIPLTLCTGADTIQLNSLLTTGTPGGTWYLDSPDNVLIDDILNPINLSGGQDYSIYYSVGQGACELKDSVQVNAISSLPIEWENPSPICQGDDDIILDDLLLNNLSGAWYINGELSNGIFTTTTPNTYYVNFVSDNDVCSDSLGQEIVVNPIDSPTLTNTTICKTDTIYDLNQLILDGDTTGVWSPDAWVVDGRYLNTALLAPDQSWEVTYNVTIGNCSAEATTQVYIQSINNVNWSVPITICESSYNIDLSNYLDPLSQGGTWSASLPNVVSSEGLLFSELIEAGDYEITYTNGTFPCVLDSTIIITIESSEPIIVDEIAVCSNEEPIDLNTLIQSSSETGQWSTTSNMANLSSNILTIAGLPIGEHAYTFTSDSESCTDPVTTTVVVVEAVTPSFLAPTSVCPSELPLNLNSLSPNPLGGSWYEQDSTTGNYIVDSLFHPTINGTYEINYTVNFELDTIVCTLNAMQNISFEEMLDPNWNTFEVCAGTEMVNLDTCILGNINGNFSGTNIANNIFNTTGLAPGLYAITYTVGTAQCDTSLTQNVEIISVPNTSLLDIDLCNSSPILDLDDLIVGDHNGDWLAENFIDQQDVVDPSLLAPGTYELSYVVGMLPCIDTLITTINISPPPIVNAGDDITICSGENVMLNGSVINTSSSYWSGGGGVLLSPNLLNTAYNYLHNEEEVVLTLQATDLCGEIIADSLILHILPTNHIVVTGDLEIELGDSTLLVASGGNGYYWTPNTDISCYNCDQVWASPTDDIVYTVTSSDECAEPAIVPIDVITDQFLYVPTAFSPNNDGFNDGFGVVGTGINSFEMRVYNRWGTMVFYTNDPDKKWDGTYRGRELDIEVYVVSITYSYFLQDTPKTYQGNLTLIR